MPCVLCFRLRCSMSDARLDIDALADQEIFLDASILAEEKRYKVRGAISAPVVCRFHRDAQAGVVYTFRSLFFSTVILAAGARQEQAHDDDPNQGPVVGGCRGRPCPRCGGVCRERVRSCTPLLRKGNTETRCMLKLTLEKDAALEGAEEKKTKWKERRGKAKKEKNTRHTHAHTHEHHPQTTHTQSHITHTRTPVDPPSAVCQRHHKEPAPLAPAR